jgi:hypothetical protein
MNRGAFNNGRKAQVIEIMAVRRSISSLWQEQSEGAKMKGLPVMLMKTNGTKI